VSVWGRDVLSIGRRLVAGALLCTFTLFAFSFTLEHTCRAWSRGQNSHEVVPHSHSPHSAGLPEAKSAEKGHFSPSGSQEEDTVCLACAWSQSLNHPIAAAEVIHPEPIHGTLSLPLFRAAYVADLYPVAHKRGPPPASLI
jgi:hypothetical protein